MTVHGEPRIRELIFLAMQADLKNSNFHAAKPRTKNQLANGVLLCRERAFQRRFVQVQRMGILPPLRNFGSDAIAVRLTKTQACQSHLQLPDFRIQRGLDISVPTALLFAIFLSPVISVLKHGIGFAWPLQLP